MALIEYVWVTGSTSNRFIGFEVTNNKAKVYLPETLFSEDNTRCKFGLRTTLMCIGRISDSSEDGYDMADLQLLDTNGISSMIKLIVKRISDGPFIMEKKTYSGGKISTGKISWKKTMQKSSLISSHNVILNLQRESVISDSDIQNIYDYCMFQSIETVGWLYDLDQYELNLPQINIPKSIKIIKLALMSNYNEDNQLILQWMLNILKQSNLRGNGISDLKFGCYNFDFIFEMMVNSVYSNTEQISTFFPTSIWKMRNGIEYKSSRLRPDSILVHDEKAYLIDAKNYRYPVTELGKDLPNTSSILKQMAYSDLVAKKLKLDSVSNIFIVPHAEGAFNDNIAYLGHNEPNWREDEKVYMFSVSMHHLMISFLSKAPHFINLISKFDSK